MRRQKSDNAFHTAAAMKAGVKYHSYLKKSNTDTDFGERSI
jgi:hypothetical protein